jgi:hypothetical protein
MFVLAAIPFARQNRAHKIALGSNMDDTGVPDGSPAFVSAFNEPLVAIEQPVKLVALFHDRGLKKDAVAELAMESPGSALKFAKIREHSEEGAK